MTVADVIAELQRMPGDTELDVRTMWTNGNTFRNYRSQDKSTNNTWTSPSNGFHKVRIVSLPDDGGDAS